MVAGVGWIVSKILDTVGPVVPVVVIALVIVGAVWFKYSEKQKQLENQRRRIEYLRAKYGDEAAVDCIMRRILWKGETAQQLIDSLGNPLSVDIKMMATRKREVWKYQQIGRGRYALRITLDNDVVIEIDHKTS